MLQTTPGLMLREPRPRVKADLHFDVSGLLVYIIIIMGQITLDLGKGSVLFSPIKIIEPRLQKQTPRPCAREWRSCRS